MVKPENKDNFNKSEGHPVLSVVMLCYNLEEFIEEAILSILKQTFTDFELLIVDNGSKDGSSDIVNRFEESDNRIRVIRLDNNIGIPAALNKGIKAAKSNLVALMDGDDISLPDRFQHQIDYLNRHPDLVALGCYPLFVDEIGSPICTLPIYEEHHRDIEQNLLRGHGWAFLQPTVIMKRDAFLQIGGYNEELPTSQDIEFFLRLSEIGEIANVPEVLFHYRLRSKSVTHDVSAVNFERHQRVLQAAYKRRGIQEQPPKEEFPDGIPRKVDQHIKWGWWALQSGHIPTARRQAAIALKTSPLSLKSWKLAFCSVRGR